MKFCDGEILFVWAGGFGVIIDGKGNLSKIVKLWRDGKRWADVLVVDFGMGPMDPVSFNFVGPQYS